MNPLYFYKFYTNVLCRSLLLKLWLLALPTPITFIVIRFVSGLENGRVSKVKEHFESSGLKTFRARTLKAI